MWVRDLYLALMVSFTTPDHDSAWRSSVGRFGAAPRLARIFLLLMVSFADAQQCANTCIGAPGYASDCDGATEFASTEFATEDGYDFITVNGVSSHGYSHGPMNVQVATETAQLVDTFSTTTFGAVPACTRGSLETLKACVAAKSLSDMTTSTGAKLHTTLDDIQTTLMVSIISYLGWLPETDAFKAKNTIDIVEAVHETDPDSMPQARSSTMGAPSLVATAPAPLPGLLAMLGLLCAALYGAVQAFAAHLGASTLASIPGALASFSISISISITISISALASIPGPPPPPPSCRPSARRGSAGRFGSAPQLVGVLFLTLVVGFAGAQTSPSPEPPPSPPPPSPPSPPPPSPSPPPPSPPPPSPAAAPISSTVDVVLARYDEVRARFLPFHRRPQRLPWRTRASCWRSLCVLRLTTRGTSTYAQPHTHLVGSLPVSRLAGFVLVG